MVQKHQRNFIGMNFNWEFKDAISLAFLVKKMMNSNHDFSELVKLDSKIGTIA